MRDRQGQEVPVQVDGVDQIASGWHIRERLCLRQCVGPDLGLDRILFEHLDEVPLQIIISRFQVHTVALVVVLPAVDRRRCCDPGDIREQLIVPSRDFLGRFSIVSTQFNWPILRYEDM